ncbi:MAG: hypothetical protein AAF597_10190, partial [Bacteroidota bacterium]
DNIQFSEGSLSPPAGDVCPTVGSVAVADPTVCAGNEFNVTASGLADLAQADNNEQDFGVEFVAFATTPADPYAGGTSLGTEPFGSLTAGGTEAALVASPITEAGTYEIYAILSPAPSDPTCRPSAFTSLTVEGSTPEITGDEVQKLSGNLQDLEANVSGGVWSFVDNSDGMGMIDDETANPALLMGTPGRSYTIRYTLNNGTCGTAFDEVTIVFTDPTTLAIGDIAFTGYTSDAPDQFSFVSLTEINAGTTISFTENGWLAAGGFRGGENTITLEFCEFFGCGSEFFVSAESTDFTSDGTVAGTVTGTFLGLSVSGDQIFAYQGDAPTAADESGFLAAIHMNGDWDAEANNTNESAQPQTFIDNPGTSVAISPEVDNASFDCVNLADGSIEDQRNSINTAANWTANNSPDNVTLPTGCDYGCPDVCETGGTPPVVTSSQGLECGETFSVGTESDWINTSATPSSGVSGNQDCYSSIFFRSPNVTDDCGVDSVAVTFSAAAGTTPSQLPATLEFGGAAGPISYVGGMDNFILPTTFFYAGVDGSATTEMTFTVFDSTGLFTATCSYFIEVTDDQAPQASCIAELEVFLDADGMVTLDSLALDNGSTDNCGIDSFSLSQSVFDCDDVVEPVEVIQTVTDAEGLTGTCTVEVSVSDTIDPVLTCQNFTYPLDINGEF